MIKEGLKEKIVCKLSNLFTGKLASVILYGSYAEDREMPYSDIDLLIILDKEFCDWREKRHIEVSLRRETSSLEQISPKSISEREFISALENYNPLILNVLSSGKALYDTGFFEKEKKRFEKIVRKKAAKTDEGYWEIAL
jgi:predicted nucleotidyltransferase